jgi:hypothetical protein
MWPEPKRRKCYCLGNAVGRSLFLLGYRLGHPQGRGGGGGRRFFTIAAAPLAEITHTPQHAAKCAARAGWSLVRATSQPTPADIG